MEKEQQKLFVKALILSMQDDILCKADRWPENWDGYELRQLIADSFKEVAYCKMEKKRAKVYRNTVIANNL